MYVYRYNGHGWAGSLLAMDALAFVAKHGWQVGWAEVLKLDYLAALRRSKAESLHLTNWFCTGPILVTGDSAGFLLLTTRRTREGKYLGTYAH
jgi:hypothetical protein